MGVRPAKRIPLMTADKVIRCDQCLYQIKIFKQDPRYVSGGYMKYSCCLNGDPNIEHAVNGNPGEFCCYGTRRKGHLLNTEEFINGKRYEKR